MRSILHQDIDALRLRHYYILTFIDKIFDCATASKTPRVTSSDDVNAEIERVAPDVLALLADGVPRNTATIVKALADRHPKLDVKRAIARLSVLGRLDLHGSRYTLAAAEAEQD